MDTPTTLKQLPNDRLESIVIDTTASDEPPLILASTQLKSDKPEAEQNPDPCTYKPDEPPYTS